MVYIVRVYVYTSPTHTVRPEALQSVGLAAQNVLHFYGFICEVKDELPQYGQKKISRFYPICCTPADGPDTGQEGGHRWAGLGSIEHFHVLLVKDSFGGQITSQEGRGSQ